METDDCVAVSHAISSRRMRDERLFPLFASLDSLSGVGPKLKPVLERLTGGTTVWDLLLHLPDRWLDRLVRPHIEDAKIGEVATVSGEVHAYHAPYSEKAPHRIQLFDGTGFLTLTFFRADGRWLQSQFPIGKKRIVSGMVEEYRGERQMTHPDYILDPAKSERPPAVEPIYPLAAGLTNKRVHGFIAQAMERVPEDLPEWVDAALLEQKQWLPFKDALAGLHTPDLYDETRFAKCRERLAYDEVLARESSFALARVQRKKRNAPPIPASDDAQVALIRSLPFSPTGAQLRAFGDVSANMASPAPMRRMLQGDVGAGKTLVGAMAALQAAKAGYQSAFMAPTEVLARQQFETLDRLLSRLGLSVSALTGRDKGKAREGTLLGLADGSINIVAGTHALFQEHVQFQNLGLIIVDEQHRFGVADRMRLAGKATSPHMLVMSATPIPRTLAQAVHGDLDVSILDEKPAGRKPVETRVIPDTRMDDVIDGVGRALGRGERAFWVCPKVDLDDDDSTAVARHAFLSDALNQPVGLVHGRLKPDEKDAALDDFRRGVTRVLVATTVIEVGVDVPEATIMVIERSEGFGLSQLHQLRGRVGRSDKPSFCLLLYRPPLGEMAKERLETLRRTNDGFEIAEADYRLRGPGDVLGVRQAGAVDYRVVDLGQHGDLLPVARKDAQHLVTADPELASERGMALRLVRELLTPKLSTPEA